MTRRRRKQVLLVDDNRHARLFLTQILNAVDIEVKQAASGPEALKLLTQHRFDAVIADMYMQPMDGIALTREIRSMADKAIRELPIVMASAQASRAIVEGGRAVGVTGFVAKPFTAAAVLTRLESALAPRGAHYIDAPMPPADPAPATAETDEGSLAYI